MKLRFWKRPETQFVEVANAWADFSSLIQTYLDSLVIRAVSSETHANYLESLNSWCAQHKAHIEYGDDYVEIWIPPNQVYRNETLIDAYMDATLGRLHAVSN